MKREILTFSNKISKYLSKPNKKFSADMTYGMLAAGSCLLTDVVDQLHENTKKVNSVERLTRHLNNGTSSTALKSYLTTIHKWTLQEPVINPTIDKNLHKYNPSITTETEYPKETDAPSFLCKKIFF